MTKFFSAQFTKDESIVKKPVLKMERVVFNDNGISTKDNRLVINVPRDDVTNFESITEVI